LILRSARHSDSTGSGHTTRLPLAHRLPAVSMRDLSHELRPGHVDGAVDGPGLLSRIVLEDFHHQRGVVGEDHAGLQEPCWSPKSFIVTAAQGCRQLPELLCKRGGGDDVRGCPRRSCWYRCAKKRSSSLWTACSTIRKGRFGVTANRSKTGSGHPSGSSPITARMNDLKPDHVLPRPAVMHRAQRAGYTTAPDPLAEPPKKLLQIGGRP
jgi:hypothetical protein